MFHKKRQTLFMKEHKNFMFFYGDYKERNINMHSLKLLIKTLNEDKKPFLYFITPENLFFILEENGINLPENIHASFIIKNKNAGIVKKYLGEHLIDLDSVLKENNKEFLEDDIPRETSHIYFELYGADIILNLVKQHKLKADILLSGIEHGYYETNIWKEKGIDNILVYNSCHSIDSLIDKTTGMLFKEINGSNFSFNFKEYDDLLNFIKVAAPEQINMADKNGETVLFHLFRESDNAPLIGIMESFINKGGNLLHKSENGGYFFEDLSFDAIFWAEFIHNDYIKDMDADFIQKMYEALDEDECEENKLTQEQKAYLLTSLQKIKLESFLESSNENNINMPRL